MWHYFLPTHQNNYRAKLLTTPFMVAMFCALLLFNNFAGLAPVNQVSAAIGSPDLLELHNAERAKAGLPPLRLNSQLNLSAQQKAQTMLNNNCWSHYCPTGTSPWTFFTNVGYKYRVAGENLAEGFYNNEDVIVAWMNSPTHKENIVRPEYEEIGFGIVTGTFQGKPNNIIIAVHFGTPLGELSEGNNVGSNDQLPSPVITDPENGTFTNSQQIEIKGRATGGNSVSIYNNNELLASTDANQGIFTYKLNSLQEGDYSLTAQTASGSRRSALSPSVKITVDRQPVIIKENQLIITKYTNSLITVNVSEPQLKSLRFKLGTQTIEFIQTSSGIWGADIPESLLRGYAEFDITTSDKANNSWEGRLNSNPILVAAQQVKVNNTVGGSVGGEAITFTKNSINIGFLVLIMLLFGIDFTVLSKTGLTKFRGRSHLHFGLFGLVGLIMVLGTWHGQISEQAQLFFSGI